MEAPPQFPGAPKKSKTGCIIGSVALVLVLCCCGGGGALLYFGRGFIGKAVGMTECTIALGQQRDALIVYAQKNGGKLPGAGNWQDDIKPFVVKRPDQNQDSGPIQVHIPDASEGVCDRTGNTTIAYNSTIAGKKLDDIKEPYETIALFETNGNGRNKSAAWTEQPFETSPVLVQTERRGWIRQPLKGQASFKDKRGRIKLAPSAGGSGMEFGSGKD